MHSALRWVALVLLVLVVVKSVRGSRGNAPFTESQRKLGAVHHDCLAPAVGVWADALHDARMDWQAWPRRHHVQFVHPFLRRGARHVDDCGHCARHVGLQPEQARIG